MKLFSIQKIFQILENVCRKIKQKEYWIDRSGKTHKFKGDLSEWLIENRNIVFRADDKN